MLRSLTVPKALANFAPPTIILNDSKSEKIMSRDRSESIQSAVTSLNSITSIKDDTPLYYCDKDLFKNSQKTTSRAELALYVAAVLTVVFMIAEVVGGYLANSLAIMTDAGHMLSDLTSFVISLIAVKMAQMKPTKRLSFGFHRAEVLGALASVLIIWILTAVLVYMAAMRIVENDFEVNADVMLITAGVGVAFNIVMGIVLHFGKTEHSHFGRSHSSDVEQGSKDSSIADDGNSNSIHPVQKRKANINIRAAFVHVLGDFVQSVGVLLAALIIKISQWPLADPICTFIFSVLVLVTTATVVRDAILVLMEAAPRHIDIDAVHLDLCSIEGVRDVHSLRIWSLTMDKSAVSVHLDTDKNCDTNHVVHEANERLTIKHGIHYITVQVDCVCSRSVSDHTLISLPSSNAEMSLKNTADEPREGA